MTLCCSDLDLCPFNSKIISLVGYHNVIPYTKFEHFGIIRFLSYCADRQTDRQNHRRRWKLTPATVVRVSNKGRLKASFVHRARLSSSSSCHSLRPVIEDISLQAVAQSHRRPSAYATHCQSVTVSPVASHVHAEAEPQRVAAFFHCWLTSQV